jgi:O-antigen/teichoic acid export membrane protein
VIGKTIGGVAFPMLARVQDRPQQLLDAYARSTALLSLFTLPATAVLAVLGPEIVATTLGRTWTGVVVPLQVLAPGVFFRLSFRVSEALAQATGAVYAIAWRQMTFAGLVVGGSVVGQAWGLTGVATGVLGAQVIQFLLLASLGIRLTGLSKGAYAQLHLGGLLVAAVVAVELALVAHVLRHANVAPLFVLVVALLVAGVTAVAMVLARDGALAGPEAELLLRYIGERVPARLAVLRRLLPPKAVL